MTDFDSPCCGCDTEIAGDAGCPLTGGVHDGEEKGIVLFCHPTQPVVVIAVEVERSMWQVCPVVPIGVNCMGVEQRWSVSICIKSLKPAVAAGHRVGRRSRGRAPVCNRKSNRSIGHDLTIGTDVQSVRSGSGSFHRALAAFLRARHRCVRMR